MIEITQETLSDDLKKQINKGFVEHAIKETGINELREEIAFIAKDKHEVLGVAVIKPFWGAMHIKYMWIKEEHRRKGLGKKLMQMALDYGINKKLKYAFVETMSFQAPIFYQKLGFKVDYIRDQLTNNLLLYYLSKRLD